MFAEPVRELANLRGAKQSWRDLTVQPGSPSPWKTTPELIEIDATFSAGDSGKIGFDIRGGRVVYDAARQTLQCKNQTVSLKPVDGKIRLHILVDRGSIECFGNDGRAAISVGHIPGNNQRDVTLIVEDGAAKFDSLELTSLKSVWQ
jgi:fructan beta-fructosidase